LQENNIQGISKLVVEKLVNRSNKLSQGRPVGAIGYVDEEGIISSYNKLTDGGVSGLPFRKLLKNISAHDKASLLEMINSLPDNAVYLATDPGQTGIVVNTRAINVFNLPVVKIGVKHQQVAGIGILYPEKQHFELATRSEEAQLNSLAARTMDEEKEALKKIARLRLKFLDISSKLTMVEKKEENNTPLKKTCTSNNGDDAWQIPRHEVSSLEESFAQNLVEKSLAVEPGREVAAFGEIDDNGHITCCSEIIVGGMGYIPSRLMASSYKEINKRSLREAYTEIIPLNTVIVHTHPGGSGVMHMSDAMAGPGMWGRPIVAVGHDEKGNIKGAMSIEPQDKLFELAEEKEELEQRFFEVDNPEEEVKLRKRRYKIAQEFTDICEQLEIKEVA